MNRLFIHNPLFRILSPFATGILVYLLILLINNNMEQVQEEFLGQELYVCIGLAFIIQEYARLSIVVINKMNNTVAVIRRTIIQFIIALAMTVLLVTVAMQLYFRTFLGYTPNHEELLIFNVLFSFITLLYLLLYTGHQLLYKINTVRLEKEEKASLAVKSDFNKFRSEINSDLLFECLESLILIMKDDAEVAEDLTDKFASLYRYILLKREDELVELGVELEMLKVQIEVYNKLSYREVELKVLNGTDCLIVPGSLLKIMEEVIKTTIRSDTMILHINIDFQDDECIRIDYVPEDKLNCKFGQFVIKDVSSRYKFYTDNLIDVNFRAKRRRITIPKLQII